MKLAAAVLLATIACAADVSGRYELRGVMEVGSELLLHPDGRYEFELAYGAADYESKGSWKLEGGSVLLTADKMDTLRWTPWLRQRKSGHIAVRCKLIVPPSGRDYTGLGWPSGGGLCWRATRQGIASRKLIQTRETGPGSDTGIRPRNHRRIDFLMPEKTHPRASS